MLVRERPRQILHLLVLLTGLSSGTARAKANGSSADALFSTTMVNVGTHDTGRVSLAELLAIVESETDMRFSYTTGEFPLGTEVVLQDDGAISLARLFATISAQNNIVFEHRDGQIAVRVRGNEGSAESEGRIDSSQLVNALATEVGEIADDNRLSRSKKEKQISAAVRAAIVAATADKENADEIMAVAMELTDTAAQTAPRFTEVIANAAAFAPPVARIKGGKSEVRAAAYGGAKAPMQGLRSGDTADDFQGHRGVIKVPRGENPDTYFPASSASSSFAPIDEVEASLSDDASTEGHSSEPDPTSEESPPESSSSEVSLPEISPAPIETPSVSTETDSDTGVIKLEKFSVEGTATRGSNSALRAERSKTAAAVDFLSADQLAKYSASDLSDVVFRMPGVSVANGQFAVVRGLSDRFLSTTLNGLKLPSPDPEKQAFQLDLLPVSAVEAIVVSKTFEPNLWAESTGGAMNIRTRAVPNEQYTLLGVGVKMNQNTSDGMLDYPIRGDSLKERLGFGSEVRLAVGEVDSTWEYVPSHRKSVPLGSSFSFEHANVIPLGGGQQLGLLLSVSNSSSFNAETGVYADRSPTRGAPGENGSPSDFEAEVPLPRVFQHVSDYNVGSSEYTTTASIGLGYELSENHAFKLAGLWVQTGDDQSFLSRTSLTTDPETGDTVAAFPYGPPYDNFPPIYAFFRASEYFRERNLTVLQLSGEHKFLIPGDPAITWSVQRAEASQLDHPFVESEFVTRLDNLNRSFEVLAGNDAPAPLTAVWAENEEIQTTGRIDSKWAFGFWGQEKAEISIGIAAEKSDRDMAGTGLLYNKPEGGSNPVGATPNLAMSQAAGDVDFEFASSSAASREIKAGYIQATLPLLSSLTLTGGARFEDYRFKVSGIGRWGIYNTTMLYDPTPGPANYGGLLGTTGSEHPPFASRKWYPGAALKWDILDSLSLRLGYSRTDGRPSFREVSPFFNKSVFTGNLVAGNPALKPSAATNYDVRLDWKPDNNNFFSISYFRKTIENPIEKFLLNTHSVAGFRTEVFVNNPVEADLSGFEAELRHGLGTWTDSLRNFSIGFNYTRIDAEVREHPTVLRSAATYFQNPTKLPLTRRLFDQPEYIANVDLAWSKPETGTRVTLAGYAISDTLTTAGLNAFTFDIYERAYTSYDLIFSQSLPKGLKLTLTVKNLTNPVRGTIHDPDATAELVPIRDYKAGREYEVSVDARF